MGTRSVDTSGIIIYAQIFSSAHQNGRAPDAAHEKVPTDAGR